MGNRSTPRGRMPVYFLSHGGPNVMYETSHPAYTRLGAFGREITHRVQPRAIVVLSAHWQGGRQTVAVNTAEVTDLIYDFYGFPAHYYQEKFPNVGCRELAGDVLARLREAGIMAEGVTRGLDHGVWAAFKCAFDQSKNPLRVPIVQLSLFASENPLQHIRLGTALTPLRDAGILIIGSGMAVHNLSDYLLSYGNPAPLPYVFSFDEALAAAATAEPGEERERKLVELVCRPDTRRAHPTLDHLLPIHVAAGAAAADRGKRLWTFVEDGMSWAQFRFGELPSEA